MRSQDQFITPAGMGVFYDGDMLACPDCSDDGEVQLHIAGEGVDAKIECRTCGQHVIIR